MKSGFVAILGRPNVGKSTLMNHILNQKISIVTDKSQTTRNNIKGIYTTKDYQIIFVDTPGIHKPFKKLGEEMNVMAYTASHDVDVNLLVIDSSLEFGSGDQYLFDHLALSDTPLIICFNKIDLSRIDKVEALKQIYKDKYPNAEMVELVAKDGFNIDLLVSKIVSFLPEGPCYYEENQITDTDEVFFIKEIIREKLLKTLKQEVPHSTAIYMNDIDWESNPLHIQATIVVEKDSQKGIVIGKGGSTIKKIGTMARQSIEALVKKHVFLELFVKVDEDWRNQDKSLQQYGYKAKNEK